MVAPADFVRTVCDELGFIDVFKKIVYIRTREHGVLPYNDKTNFINKIIRII